VFTNTVFQYGYCYVYAKQTGRQIQLIKSQSFN